MTNSIWKNRHLVEYLSVIAASLIFLISGLLLGTVGPMIVKLEKYGYHEIQPVSKTVTSWMINAANIGIIPGSIVVSYLSDTIGRKYTIVSSIIHLVISHLCMLFANDIYMIYASCFMRGIYIAYCYGILPTYVSEISTAKIRGPSTVFGWLLLPIGGLLGGIIQSITSISATTIILTIIGLCTVPFFFIIPESPYYYMSKKQDDECKSVLRKLRRTQNIENEFVEIQSIWNEMEKSKDVGWSELFENKLNFRVLLICLGIVTVQQFSGFSPVFAYATNIMYDSGLNFSLLTISLLIHCVGISSTTASLLTVESLGRRKLYVVICVMAILGHVIVGSCFYIEHFHKSIGIGIFKSLGMVCFLFSLAYGMGFIHNILSAELFPTDIKAKGISILTIVQAIESFVVTVMYNQLYSIHDYLPFFVFFILTVIGLIFGYFCVPETKNKSLIEIQKELNLKL